MRRPVCDNPLDNLTPSDAQLQECDGCVGGTIAQRAAPPVCRQRRRGAAGFTLLEVMVATAVFLIGFAGLIGMQLAAAKTTLFTTDLSMASNLASNTIEMDRVTAFDSIADATVTYNEYGVATSVPADVLYTVTTKVTTDPDNTYKDVTVKTQWQRGGVAKPHRVTIESRIIR